MDLPGGWFTRDGGGVRMVGVFLNVGGVFKRRGWSFLKGMGMVYGRLAAFDMGVLGPMFWVLHLMHWWVLTPVGCQHSKGWGWGAYLGFFSSLLHGRPCPGLPHLSPFSSCSFSPTYTVSLVFVVLVGLIEAVMVFKGSWWLSNGAGCC